MLSKKHSCCQKRMLSEEHFCTNQQPSQRGDAVYDPAWVEIAVGLSEGLNYPVLSVTQIIFFDVLPPERPQKDSMQLL